MIQTDLNKKGKSFRWVGGWKENEHYFNTEFVQDFCRIEGAVVVCKASHFSTEENKPKIIFDEQGNEIGIEKNAYWEIAILPNTDFIISGDNIPDGIITADKLADKAVAIDKLNDDLQSKVNNNVKYVEQNLNNSQAKTAAKNILIKDADGNFYLGSDFYSRAISSDSTAKPSHCVFGTNFRDNKFTGSGDKSHNFFGNNVNGNEFKASFAANTVGNNVSENVFEYNARHNTIGNNVRGNIFKAPFDSNQIGNDVLYNTFGPISGENYNISDCVFGNYIKGCYFYGRMKNCIFEGDMNNVSIFPEHNDNRILQNIHILSGIKGSGPGKLSIIIPDKYLNSSRELIITTKVANDGVSTPDDIVMYYADEVATQNQLSEGLATIQSLTNTDIDKAIN